MIDLRKFTKSNIILHLLVHGYMIMALLTLFMHQKLAYLFGAHSLKFSYIGIVAFENANLRLASIIYYVVFVVLLMYAYLKIIFKRNFKVFLVLIIVDIAVSSVFLLGAMVVNLYFEVLYWIGILISIIYFLCLKKAIKHVTYEVTEKQQL